MEMDARGRSVGINCAVQTRRLFRRYRGISAASACLAIIATPALSLSCLRPDVANTFNDLNAQPQEYVVLHGNFDTAFNLAPAKKPKTGTATFSGQILTKDGFVPQPDIKIDVTLSCISVWCAKMGNGRHVAFVEKTDAAPKLSVGPCYGNLFTDPTDAQLKTLETCAYGGRCNPAE